MSESKIKVVAEVSANHGGSLLRAKEIVKAAYNAKADAVKFQVYTPDTLTINCSNEYFMVKHEKWGGRSLYDLYSEAATPWDWMPVLKELCDSLGITFFATAFDKTAVDFLEDLNVEMHKIASFELPDLELIKYAASTKKPLVMSTGMATFEDIEDAVNVAKDAGCSSLTLLKCVSDYPANPRDMNLRTILDMKEKFKCNVGLSDHSLGDLCATTAASLGVSMIEKHFTISRADETVDSFFSIEPEDLTSLVKKVRNIESSLGNVMYGSTDSEKKNKVFRRSLFVVENIKKDEKLTRENIKCIRPGYGLSPSLLPSLLGKTALNDMFRGEPLRHESVDWKS